MPLREQTDDPWDDAACRFYGVGTTYALLAGDDSQFEDDMLSDANAAYENSARFNHGQPRTMLFEFAALATSDSGTLWRHGTGGNTEALQMAATSGGNPATLSVIVNNATQFTWDLPNTLGSCYVAWVTEPNPDPDAGASDAALSWLYLYSATSGDAHRVQFAHPTKNSEATTAYVGSSSSGGVNAMTEQIRTFGFWSRLLSMTELAETHWDTTSPPTTIAGTERQGLPVAPATIDAQNEMHGPAAQAAASALGHARWRCMGALLNERFRHVETIDYDTGNSNAHAGNAIGSGDYVWSLGWFRVYPVSPTANAVFVRVHARIWCTVGGRDGAWGLRVYVMNRRPVIGQVLLPPGAEPPGPLESRSATVELLDDNSSGTDPGRWRIEATVPIVRGDSGIARDKVYVALAWAIDPGDDYPASGGEVNEQDLRLEVKAAHVVQLFDATVGQPFGGGPSGEAG